MDSLAKVGLKGELSDTEKTSQLHAHKAGVFEVPAFM
jgi:hypothetical protein